MSTESRTRDLVDDLLPGGGGGWPEPVGSTRGETRDASPWFESAADLLAEPDPGETPFLVEDLIVEGAIAALVGAPKGGKTWVVLDLAVAIAAGESALDSFAVAEPGPVLLVLEESGRAALHRRLDKLARGRALGRERLAEFYFAANRRVRLDDLGWRNRLLEAARARKWRLIVFDPLARVKGLVDENVQREIGPVLDFLRELRAESGAAVLYVHHTPHEGTRHRGSSDLEAYWESKLTLIKEGGKRTLRAEHREAEAAGPFVVSFGFDATTGTLRLRTAESELEEQVRDYLADHPDASANEVDEAIEGTRQRILEIVKRLREGGSESPEPPGTTPPGHGGEVVRGAGSFKNPRTTPGETSAKVVPGGPNHPGTTPSDEAEAELYDELVAGGMDEREARVIADAQEPATNTNEPAEAGGEEQS